MNNTLYMKPLNDLTAEKKWQLCDRMEVVANAIVVISL